MLIRALDMVPKVFVGLLVPGDLREPYDCFDCFDLAEEGANALKIVVPPMLQEAGSGGRDTPIGLARQPAPGGDARPDFVDNRPAVFLLLGGKAVIGIQVQRLLIFVGPGSLLSRLGNRRNSFRAAAPGDRGIVSGLAFFVQRVMSRRFRIGRVQNRLFVKCLGHRAGAFPILIRFGFRPSSPPPPAGPFFAREERLNRRSYSSVERTTTTGRPCFSIVTGSARAVSKSKPKPFLASFADIDFIDIAANPDEPFGLLCLIVTRLRKS